MSSAENSLVCLIVNTIFVVLFLCIIIWLLLYMIFRVKIYGFKQLFKHQKAQVVSLVVVLAFIQCLICLEIYVVIKQPVYNDDHIKNESFHISILTILTLLPLPFYYMVFTIDFSLWIDLSYSMIQKTGNDHELVKKCKLLLKILNAIICVVFFVIFVLLLITTDIITKYVLSIGEIIWISLMSISIILFLFYGLLKSKQVRGGVNESVKVQQACKQTKRTENKLMFIVAGLALFFIIQSVITIYFAYFDSNLNIYWIFGDAATHLICLLALFNSHRIKIIRCCCGIIGGCSANNRLARKTRSNFVLSEQTANIDTIGLSVDGAKDKKQCIQEDVMLS